jgi:hypothetical protein
MRNLLVLALVAGACGGSHKAPGPGGATASNVFPGSRWVPAKPTYVLAAASFRDAQSAFRDAIDITGVAVGGEPADVARALQQVLGVDPLSIDAVAQIGVDVGGPVVAFSEDIDPTFVVHLSDPTALTAFLDRQRQGLRMTSQVADGVEVFSATLDRDLQLSWAVDKDWLWVHFATVSQPFVAWFEHSHRATAGTWTSAWDWAKAQAKGQGLTGFVELRDVLAALGSRVQEVQSCAKQFDSVERVGIAIASDGKSLDARVTVQTPNAPPVYTAPPGWRAASQGMPLAATWNADLRAVGAWLQPCVGDVYGEIAETGIVTLRAFIKSLDTDDKSGVGAVSADLSSSRYINAQLDEVPMRSRLEKDRQFGIYKGKHLSVPFVATVDYVLNDKTFIAAMGDGVLTKIGTGTPEPSDVGSIDIIPSGLPVDTWEWLLSQIHMPNQKRVAQRLQSWQQLHVGARHDGNALLIEATGTRR